jgi:Glycosyltransferase family 17
MIYEFFSFYNEFDMLELKLQEHYPHVDRFVITESNKTYNQTDKPYRLESQWDRYSKWRDKITYLKFDANGLKAGWETEHAQREYGIKQTNFQPEDILVIDDLDEILRPQDWQWSIDNIHTGRRELLFEMTTYWCYADVLLNRRQQALAMVLGKNYINSLTHRRPQQVFKEKKNPLKKTTICKGGVHLSWFGGEQQFKEKLQGSIEGYTWTQGRDPDEEWQNKQQGRLFHYKKKFTEGKTMPMPLEQNDVMTDSMKKFIKKHPEWLLT